MTRRKLSDTHRSIQIRASSSSATPTNHHPRVRPKPSHRRRRHRRTGDSFILLFFQVGFVLLFVCIFVYVALIYHHETSHVITRQQQPLPPQQQRQPPPPPAAPRDRAEGTNQYAKLRETEEEDIIVLSRSNNASSFHEEEETEDEEEETKETKKKEEEFQPKADETPTPTTDIPLNKRAQFDPFGISQHLPQFDDVTENEPLVQTFLKLSSSLKTEFATRYGGEHAARAMLQRGLSTFGTSVNDNDIPSDIRCLANRILSARTHQRPFHISFGGYSVTVGRGNYHHQSFPFVVRDVLTEAMDVLGVELRVKNAAIGGIPSFPYGWCMENFWGQNADVVSWDYSMNEPGGRSEGLEAYVRHGLRMKRRPMLILKDTHMAGKRKELIQRYVDQGYLIDPIIIHTDPAAEPFLTLPEHERPPGFQEWRKFGAPMGAPGQAKHHPAVKEHELIGWMIAMHFLSALEVVAADIIASSTTLEHGSLLSLLKDVSANDTLPVPFSNVSINKEDGHLTSLLYGVPSTSSTTSWKLNPIHCRTTFDPIVSGPLKDIVLSGTTAETIDIMLPKGPMFYNQAWVLDVGDMEKTAKRKLERYGGLGYVDIKKAYYGIKASGVLQLFLPGGKMDEEEEDARRWFHSIAVCEVNEQRGEGECQLERDVDFVVGGVEAKNVTYMDAEGLVYLGKKICVNVEIPLGAKLMRRQEVEGGGMSSFQRGQRLQEEDRVGITLDMAVNNPHVMVKTGACSVSHVIWEENVVKNDD